MPTDKRKEQYHKLAVSDPKLTILSDHPLSPDETYRDSFNLDYHLGPVFDIIRNNDTVTPMTIAIYGDWGTGKTTAMKWLEGLIDIWNDAIRIDTRTFFELMWSDFSKCLLAFFYIEEKQKRIEAKAVLNRRWSELSKFILGMIYLWQVEKRHEAKALLKSIWYDFSRVLGRKITSLSPGGLRRRRSLKPLWFYPWKYDNKEDVQRGLIAEVIINSIDVRKVTRGKLKKAAKDFGLFLGKSFLHVLSAIKPTATSAVKGVLKEFGQALHPEKAYLNEFETTLRSWIEGALGKNERMVIFIDDLDRCMPEIALQVLEALKLYLNIENLIFVVGLDREVIDILVEKHYEGLGFDRKEDKKKSGSYLDKMFQVEVRLEPSEKQIGRYLDEWLQDREYWKNKLSNDERHLFGRLIFKFSKRNPREVKRLINSALITGAGAEMIKSAKNDDRISSFEFKQGLQVFFIRKILNNDPYNMPKVVGSNQGDEFFQKWSQIVCENEGDEKFSRTVKVPADFGQEPSKGIVEKDVPQHDREKQVIKHILQGQWDLSFAHVAYHELLRNQRFSHLFNLLADEDLGDLMLIEYSPMIAIIVKETDVSTDADIIREAVARELKKKPEKITKEDYDKIKALSLSDTNIANLNLIKGMAVLTSLFIERTPITDLEPIEDLKNLQRLALADTDVADLEPLRRLTGLNELYLSGTKVSDIEPLRELPNLWKLDLRYTEVVDLQPLEHLENLKRLDLRGTKVTNFRPLESLKKLERLYLSSTKISSLNPIKDLTGLSYLDISHTGISDLSPIKQLTKLSEFFLSRSKVSDLAPIKGLNSLQTLAFSETSISNLEPLKGLRSIIRLSLSKTQVNDFTPLKALTDLEWLDLSFTQISNLQPLKDMTGLTWLTLVSVGKVTNFDPIKNLKDLRVLDLTATQFENLSLIKDLANLEKLYLTATEVKDLSPMKSLINLTTLDLTSARKITDLDPLKELESLRELNLRGTKVTNEQVASLHEALPELIINR